MQRCQLHELHYLVWMEAAEIGVQGERRKTETMAPKQEAETETRIGPVESLVLTGSERLKGVGKSSQQKGS